MAALAANEVEIWVVEPDEHAGAEPSAMLLTSAEIERFAYLDRDAHAIAISTRAVLRTALARHLRMATHDVRIVEGRDRKPVLAGRELEFSVSHTDGVAMVAVACVAVGIDVERAEPIVADEFDDLVAFVLDARELDELARLPERERLTAYYRAWTRKEAYVKATGEGIAGRPLPEVVVGIGMPALVEVVGLAEAELAPWTVLDLDVPTGYVASLVVRHPKPRVRVGRWAWP